MPINSTRLYEYCPEPGTDAASDGAVYGIPALSEYIGKTARITAYLGGGGNVHIPEKLDGVNVTSIGEGAFGHCGINRAILPEGIIAVCTGAFYGCRNLSEIYMPKTLQHIGESCFAEAGITSVVLPDSVTEIKKGAFYMCGSLKTVVLGKNTRVIGWGAFGACASLKGIKLPELLREIDFGAFIFNPIEKMFFPAGLKRVSAGIFNWRKAENTIECAFKGRNTRIIDAGETGVGLGEDRLFGRVDKFYGVKRIYCPKGSRAEKYAREHMISFRPFGEFQRDEFV